MRSADYSPTESSLIQDLQLFVISSIYGDTKSNTLGEARTAKLRTQKKKT